MGCWEGPSAGSLAYIITVLALLVFFGCTPSTSEPTESEESGLGNLHCPEVLTVGWNEDLFRPPYVTRTNNTTNDYEGLLPAFLEAMLAYCCRTMSTLVYNSSETADLDLHLPIVVNLEADCNSNKQSNLVPMVPDTGIAFVLVKNGKSNPSLQMMKSLFSTWPVLVFTLILSLIAGIIVWSLETRKNSENFPHTFTRGTWEGFWWAFISMTTVGYGDRCPRSVGGRLFAVLWILVGICVISIFTASLTSTLTTLSLQTKIALPGAKVVVLLDSIESTTGFRNQADLKRVPTAQDIHEELNSERVQGALMDAYSLAYFKQNFPTSKLYTQEIIQHSKLEYGVKVKNIELAACFREKRYTKESDLYEMADLILTKPLTSGLSNGGKEESNIFDPQGFLFFPMFYTCVGVTVILIAAGVARDLCHKFQRKLAKNKDSGKRNMLFPLKENGCRSQHAKCYVSQEKLQELENKIQDVTLALDLIKSGIV